MIAAEPLVRIDGLVKHYGKVEAVRGIDLEVQQVGGVWVPGA